MGLIKSSVGAIAGSEDRSKTSAAHFSALSLEVPALSDPRDRSRTVVKITLKSQFGP